MYNISEIDQIINITQDLGLHDVSNDLEFLKKRLEQPNKDLIMPLVGEFSSGKTSLINALTDNKQLETASKATTATIFEIRFGCEGCYAEIIRNNGEVMQTVEDIASLKNNTLQNVDLVRIYDTSNKVSSSTVLVDTPGLSSNDTHHKLALTSYLPHADAILLLTDVNQQITRSLINFVNDAKLVEKPIYLVITKCDTKTENEIESVKKYIVDNINLPIENMICISAMKDELQELYTLFDKIQRKKNDIVVKAINGRIKTIIANVSDYIDELLQSAKSDSTIDEKIHVVQENLQRISRNIEKLIRDASGSIEEKGEDCIRKFRDNIFSRLDGIVQSQGRDCDGAIYTAVNSIAETAIQQYKTDIQYVLVNMARERQRTLEEVPLQSLEALDLSNVVLNSLSYNLNLSSMGHEYDRMIGNTVKVVAAVTAVVGGVAAVGGAATATAGTAAVASKAIDVADTATDAASIVSNINTRKKMQQMMGKAKDYTSKINEEIEQVDKWDKSVGEKYVPQKRGAIETGVGWITDKIWGKPQRRRAINNYISESLIPEFTLQMENIRAGLIRTIGQLLHDEAQNRMATMEQSLNELKAQNASAKEQFQQRINKLKEYKTILKNG